MFYDRSLFMNYKSFGFSDPGKANKKNEDSFLCNNEDGLFLVADGMGGHASGETASKLAIQTINEFVVKSRAEEVKWPIPYKKVLSPEMNRFTAGTFLANLRIKEAEELDPSTRGMGTTIAGALIDGENLAIINVGDSRVYRVRDKIIRQITTDHSLAREHARNGIISEHEAKQYPLRHILTRALGHINNSSKIDTFISEIKQKDLYMICSDGLYNMVGDDKILKIIGSVQDNSLYKIGLSLVLEANLSGGMDNITVVLILFP
jgi:serine/threonine protein phosphatase PrpC